MKTVQEYGHLSEFEILRESCREDVTQKGWAQEGNREMTVSQLRLARAREEIVRLDVEVQRTLAFMSDDLKARERVILDLQSDNRCLAMVVESETELLRSVYSKVRVDLSKLYGLEGYSSALKVGVAQEPLPKSTAEPIPSHVGRSAPVLGVEEEDLIGDESDETIQAHFALMTVLEHSQVD